MRGGAQPPSSVRVLPPRTMNLPPNFATSPGVCLRYSAIRASSVVSTSTIMYAGTDLPPRSAGFHRQAGVVGPFGHGVVVHRDVLVPKQRRQHERIERGSDAAAT